jgi:Rieske 2Fe-2S family protein
MSASAEPFEKVFAPILDKFSHWNLPLLRRSERITYELKANWKFVFQNYNECYHCPPVHPRLAKMTPYTAAENDLVEGPFIGGFMPITNGGSLTLSEKTCALPVGDIKNEDHQRVYYYSIFPNMLLSLHPDYAMFHLIIPQSAGRTLIHCDWLFHPDAFGREDFHPEDAVGLWDMTNKEDWHVCELSQKGTSSRSYQPSPYSPRESLPAAFDRFYLITMGIR